MARGPWKNKNKQPNREESKPMETKEEKVTEEVTEDVKEEVTEDPGTGSEESSGGEVKKADPKNQAELTGTAAMQAFLRKKAKREPAKNFVSTFMVEQQRQIQKRKLEQATKKK